MHRFLCRIYCVCLGRELRHLLTRELGIMMRREEMRRLVDSFDTNEVCWLSKRGPRANGIWLMRAVHRLTRNASKVVSGT